MSIMCGIKLDADHVFNSEQKSSRIGKRFKTRNSGWATVIDGDYQFLRVRFENTGNERVYSAGVFSSKTAKDIYAKNILGVACIGNASKKNNIVEYRAWHHMINRCYNPKEPYFESYGGLGVSVSERWKVFEYFLEDYSLIEKVCPMNYRGTLHLDKDLKQFGLPDSKKIYSLETCSLVTNVINQHCKPSTRVFDAFHEDGRVAKNFTVGLFSNEYSETRPTSIRNVLNSGDLTRVYKGWRFRGKKLTQEVLWELVDKLNKMEENK